MQCRDCDSSVAAMAQRFRLELTCCGCNGNCTSRDAVHHFCCWHTQLANAKRHVLITNIVMAFIVTAYIVMAHIIIAYIVAAHIVMLNVIMLHATCYM